MGKKTNRSTEYSNFADEDINEDDMFIATDEDGTRRAIPPARIERIITGDELAAAMRTQADLRTDPSDEPVDTRQRVPGAANSAAQVASTTSTGAAATTEPSVPPANSAGAKGTARPATKDKPTDSSKSRSSSTTDRPTDPRKKEKKAKTPAASQPQDELSAEDLASLEVQFTIDQAQLLVTQDTTSRTDAEFRQEITHFWENWCRVHTKKPGSMPDPFSEDWKKHKLGKHLWARYKRYRLDVRMREVDDRRGLVSSVTTSAATSVTTTTQSADGTSTTTTSTSQLQTISSSVIDSTTSPEKTDTSASAAPPTTTEPMPELELTAEELDILEGPKEDTQMDHPDAIQFAEEFLRDNYDVETAAQGAQTDQPPQPPANSAGTAGVQSSETANSAASAVASTGEAVQVPSARPPLSRGTSQSGAEDRSRPQSSAKRTREPSGTTQSPPAQRGRRQQTPAPPRRLSPGVERHRNRRNVGKMSGQDNLLSPVIDPRVFKETAVAHRMSGAPPIPWMESFRHKNMEFLGQINAFTVPWTFLAPGQYNEFSDWRADHALKDVTMATILGETARLPHRYLLGHTFGIDPSLWQMVTEQTGAALHALALQKYWEPVPGIQFRMLGLGPTGLDLSDCSDVNVSLQGQRDAFRHHAVAAVASRKCLSIRVNRDDEASSVDIHTEARWVLHEAGISQNHPIYLQEFRANYHELCDWLDAYPNTVIAFDLPLLRHLEHITTTVTPSNALHEAAAGLLEFVNLAPLANISIHSAAFALQLDLAPRRPADMLQAAETLGRLTDSQGLVYIEQTAANMGRLYQLNTELFDHARWTEDRRQRPRCTIQTLRQTIDATILRRRLVPAARADQDQGAMDVAVAGPPANSAGGQRSNGPRTPPPAAPSIPPPPPPALPPANSAGDQVGTGTDAVVVPSVDPSPTQSLAGEVRPPKASGTRRRQKYRSGSSSNTSLSFGSRSSSSDRERRPTKARTSPPRSRSPSYHRSPTPQRRSRSTTPSRRSSYRSGSDRHSEADRGHRHGDDDHRREDRHQRREERLQRNFERHQERQRREDERRRRDRQREQERRLAEERRLEDERRMRDHERRRDYRSSRDGSRDRRRSQSPRTSRDTRRHSPIRREEYGTSRSRDTSTRRRDPRQQSPPTFAIPTSAPQRKHRQPIRAPTPDTHGTSRDSSQASTGTQRSFTDRLRGRVMAATAVSPANSAGAPYVVPPRSQRPPANSAGVAPTLRRATADDLFKPHPLPPVPPRRPTEKDLYAHVEAYLRPEVDTTSGLRAIVTDEFTSLPIDPPQQEGFLVPPEASWEPTHRCESTDEGTMFHQQIGPASYIPFARWKTHPAFMEQTRYQSLQLVGDLHVRSFGHMILVAWAARLATNDDRILYIVDFIHQVLESFDWEDEIPKLIADYQPRMVVTGTTREPWPAFRDFRIAAERWVGCCRHAFRYIFDRLTGPIVWNPRWLQSNQVPDLFRTAIRDEMTAQAELMFNNLRHMVYRQYGLRHIRAELNRQTIGWARFDNTHNRESIRNGTCVRAETLIFAEEPVYDSFSARLRPDVFMAQIANGNRAAVRDAILDYYPGPEVRRVVFWIGRNYNTEDDQDGLDELIIELCHIYAQYCSYVEQFVILPPYHRVQRVRWMQTLRLLVQQDQVLPFARVIVHTTDLQYFERDRRLGIRSAWPATFHTSEDGRYLDEQAIEGRKNLLRRGHGLTLWTKYAKTAPAAKTAPDASLPILDYSAVPTPRTTRVGAANSAAPSVGSSTSTKTATTIKTKASAGPLAANSAAGQVTQPTPLAIVPTPPLALPTSSTAPDQLQFDIAALIQQQQQILLLLQQASAQQPSLAATTSVPPRKDKPRHKDQHSDQDE